MNNPDRLQAQASSFLGSAHLRKAALYGSLLAESDLQNLEEFGYLQTGARIEDGLENLYRELSKEYRSEIVYKNRLARRFISQGRGSGQRAFVQELRVADSILDIASIGTQVEALEIKTEYDNPDKLAKQLSDYWKIFPKVSIVCHESKVELYSKRIANTPAGLIAMTDRCALRRITKPSENHSSLDVRTMVEALRKPEYSSIIERLFGRQPAMPNTDHFRHHLDLALQANPRLFARETARQLRQRTPRLPATIYRTLPESILASSLRLDPSENQYRMIVNWLNYIGDKNVLSVSQGKAI